MEAGLSAVKLASISSRRLSSRQTLPAITKLGAGLLNTTFPSSHRVGDLFYGLPHRSVNRNKRDFSTRIARIMPEKRPADLGAAVEGKRGFKQTKLNFQPLTSKTKQATFATSEAQKEPGQGSSNSTSATPGGDNVNKRTDPTPPTDKQRQQRPPPDASSSSANPATADATAGASASSNANASYRIRIVDRPGDLFSAPRGAVLIHACNALGVWGGGVALAFHDRYPDAYRAYRKHCLRSTPDRLAGTALLIPPARPSSGERKEREEQEDEEPTGSGHYVGCIFTSRKFGRGMDSPQEILRLTAPAMRDLMRLVAEEGDKVTEVRMCRINSGIFNVPWAETKKAIEGMVLGRDGEPVPAVVKDGVLEVVAWERPEWF
ncbi:hypothetical protein VTJ83DRAFT_6303 [Remersonia thermophila]|uniref:ADP-ribose 1''-phosphate phosphatase n=1 Tax=Remersonia thermophila TaxID=72144 RepID=A0ABR4D4D1_9PEZI